MKKLIISLFAISALSALAIDYNGASAENKAKVDITVKATAPTSAQLVIAEDEAGTQEVTTLELDHEEFTRTNSNAEKEKTLYIVRKGAGENVIVSGTSKVNVSLSDAADKSTTSADSTKPTLKHADGDTLDYQLDVSAAQEVTDKAYSFKVKSTLLNTNNQFLTVRAGEYTGSPTAIYITVE
jgi:hypothetical protein